MKRISALLLAMLLLCGCAAEPEPQQTAAEPTEASTVPVPTDPELPNFGLYEADTTVEVLTHGAVKQFPLEIPDVYAVAAFGEGLLLFSGGEETTLTYLTEEAEPLTVALSGCRLSPDDPSTWITEQGIVYFDDAGSAVVTLDGQLQETTRVSLTAQMGSASVLSPDGERMYYFDEMSLRCLELKTGISRLLKECSFLTQEVRGLHFDGTVLECYVSDGTTGQSLFVSAETGETLFMSGGLTALYTAGAGYFAQYAEGNATQYLFGSRADESQCLTLGTDDGIIQPMLPLNGVATYRADSTGTTLNYYDLELGTHAASARLSGVVTPWSLTADADRGLIWFLAVCQEEEATMLYCWEPALSATGDAQSCVTPYYTALAPDTTGLDACARQAKALADRYGLRIRIWEDALLAVPEGYTFQPEHLTTAYEQALSVLEAALSRYPEGFFKTLGKHSDNDILTISLIRSAYGDNELGTVTQEEGVFFWDNGSAYVALTMGDRLEQTFYHELFHAIDSYVLTQTLAYDFWDALNPEGFTYDYSYITNQSREGQQYLENATRSFIDVYSMSYPKEDRARIMEYAMMPGNEPYFLSDAMQAKLKTLCQGIREAFGLEKYSASLPWEQYLK